MGVLSDVGRIAELIAQLDEMCDEARRITDETRGTLARRPFWPERRRSARTEPRSTADDRARGKADDDQQ